MEKFYTPILKWKRGEQVALQYLYAGVKEKIKPLIEITPIPFDYVNDREAKTIDEHLENVCNQISSSWGNKPLFIDLLFIDNVVTTQDGRHPLQLLIDDSIKNNVTLIPTTGCRRNKNYNQTIKDAFNKKLISEVCIRLEDDDFVDVDVKLANILKTLKVSANNCHLIIDMKYIPLNDINSKILSFPTVINNIPNINDWISLTLCATGFPENLSSVSTNSIDYISRTEWNVWNKVTSKPKLISRIPQYGDYAIANPFMNDVDPRIMQMSGNIRYTSDDSFIIFKGASVKISGWNQMMSLCKKIVKHPKYCQQTFSWGDKYIYDCSLGAASTGNAETWRRVGTNHHITFIVDQLSNLSYF